MKDAFFDLKNGERCDLESVARFHREFLAAQTADARYTLHYRGKSLSVSAPAGIYHPGETSTSQFTLRHLPPLAPGKSLLEVGCGTGAIGLALALHGAKVTLIDINPKAVACASANASANALSVSVLQSDLFEKVTQKFDCIVANLPLLHMELSEFDDLLGTDKSGALMRRFLAAAVGFLNDSGEIIFTFSNISDPACLQNTRFDFDCLGGEFSGESGIWRWLMRGKNRP